MPSPSTEGQLPPQKNRRVEQACGRCRTKKIRCDSGIPSCSPCQSQDALCVYSQTRRRGKGKTQEYVRKLEQRMENLEALLRPTTLEPESSAPPEGLVEHRDLLNGSPSSSKMPETETNGRTIVATIDAAGGESSRRQTSTASDLDRSSLSVRKSVQLPSKAPLNFLASNIAEHDLNSLRGTISSWQPGRYNYAPMLPMSEQIQMIELFLQDFNATFPIFHSRSLLLLCRRNGQEASNSVDPSWWACINTIIAIITQSRATNDAFRKVSEFSWGYFKNAFSVFGEIIVMEPSIRAVQALLAMASFLGRSSDLKSALLLSSTVMRTIQLMRLNKEDASTKLSVAEIEQRRRVVWAAFLLDTTLSVKAGQPPALEATEIKLGLPDENSIHDTESRNAPDVMNPMKIFILRIQLAIIYSKVHKLLLSGHFTQEECRNLWIDLEAWEGSDLITIRPESNLHPKASPPVLLLHLTYYDCINLMHTITDLQSRQWGGDTRVLAQATSSIDFPPMYFTCSHAEVARATLSMISCMDGAPFVDIWIALPSILSAAFSLISDAFADLNDDHSIDYVRLIDSLVQFLETLQRQGCDIRRLSKGCAKLLIITKCLVFKEQCILHEDVHKLLSITSNSTTTYRDFSQGLMTNLPKLAPDSFLANAAADIFDPSKQRTCFSSPLLSPEDLMPNTFNFGITGNRAHGKDTDTENAVCTDAQ